MVLIFGHRHRLAAGRETFPLELILRHKFLRRNWKWRKCGAKPILPSCNCSPVSPSDAQGGGFDSSAGRRYDLPSVWRRPPIPCNACASSCTGSQDRRHRSRYDCRDVALVRASSIPIQTGACIYSPAAVRSVSPAECRAGCPGLRSCVSSFLDRRFLPRGTPATS
jgi:hypothetical protein